MTPNIRDATECTHEMIDACSPEKLSMETEEIVAFNHGILDKNLTKGSQINLNHRLSKLK